jgi:hypothetical protein
LLGWTALGWIISLVWSLTGNTRRSLLAVRGPPAAAIPATREADAAPAPAADDLRPLALGIVLALSLCGLCYIYFTGEPRRPTAAPPPEPSETSVAALAAPSPGQSAIPAAAATTNQPLAPAALAASPSPSPSPSPPERPPPPPDSFRGVGWGSPLPRAEELRRAALKGCPAIVEEKNLTDAPPCGHMHIATADDVDMFTQRRNVAAIYGVSVSEQSLEWSHRKFSGGQVFISDYTQAQSEAIRRALVESYGPAIESYGPADEEPHFAKWRWPERGLEIVLHADPVAKPPVGGGTPHTVLSLSFQQTEPAPTPRPSPLAASPDSAPETTQCLDAAIAVHVLRSSLRDPDSLVLESVYSRLPAMAVCINYRAKNGFGGVNRERVAFYNLTLSKSVKLWNQQCAGEGFHDVSLWNLSTCESLVESRLGK